LKKCQPITSRNATNEITTSMPYLNVMERRGMSPLWVNP